MQHRQEGQTIPEVTFRTRNDHAWVDVHSSDIFTGRTVIVFSLPGAFTPTCSSAHVPRYNQLAGTFRALGVDEIVCLSVNDAFVMEAWREDQQADQIRFLPDGNGDFTRAMGLLVDKSDLGFGPRSWRYAMLVRNGVIEKLFVEPEVPGDPFGVSDADTMLAWMAPDAPKPLDVAVFSRRGCPHCARAKGLLAAAGIDYEERVLGRDFSDRTLRAISPVATFPRIFIGGTLIGGADELDSWLAGRDQQGPAIRG